MGARVLSTLVGPLIVAVRNANKSTVAQGRMRTQSQPVLMRGMESLDDGSQSFGRPRATSADSPFSREVSESEPMPLLNRGASQPTGGARGKPRCSVGHIGTAELPMNARL
uniref:Uncharacterized protein n=1 Tax=Haptolina brevifila TaxID=156173 RepID=A0A7S2CX97_9EUKA